MGNPIDYFAKDSGREPEALSDEALQALNAQLDVEGCDEATIAHDRLVEEGFRSE